MTQPMFSGAVIVQTPSTIMVAELNELIAQLRVIDSLLTTSESIARESILERISEVVNDYSKTLPVTQALRHAAKGNVVATELN